MTTLINLYGGPGVGKSTIASGLFYHLKINGHSAELVGEYVKRWAWQDKLPGKYDQVYIFGKQARNEYELYGKVDYLIADSPLLLSPVYEKIRKKGDSLIEEAAFNHVKKTMQDGIKYKNFFLERGETYDDKGRYESEEAARDIDKYIRSYLDVHFVPYTTIDCNPSDRVEFILRGLDEKD